MLQKSKQLAGSLVLFLLSVPSTALALDAGSLIGMLTSQLGVSEQQATGGASALLSTAKGNMSAGDYTQLLQGAPDLSSLASQAIAPEAKNEGKSGGIAGLLGDASALMGGNKTLGKAAKLAQQFESLGLSADMVAKFGKVMVDYVKGTGGADLASLLADALSF